MHVEIPQLTILNRVLHSLIGCAAGLGHNRLHSPGAAILFGKAQNLGKSVQKPNISILSNSRILAIALFACCAVLAFSLLSQWFVYYDWLHETGPMRIIGTCLATLLTFAFVIRWQLAQRERQRRMLHRFETIARMNDLVRNSLQKIECVTYLSRPEATEPVREAVQTIDSVLREVLADVSAFEPDESAGMPLKARKQSA
ncbi:MAG TPA: hypothetical protein VKW78_00590 [Terriglobales bacterium]|nr:hypothetical protein [Terriglobales bacterium]